MVTEATGRRARIGVVGCGSWSNEAHLPALAARSDAEVVALADPSASRRSETATRFGVEATFAAHDQMYDSCELDGVIVATPHSTHYEIARAGIAHGAHVLVEKPMVLDPADARSLLAAARRERREVIVGYPWHFNRHTLELREVLRSGDLGTIEFVTCLFASSVREYYRGAADAYRDVLPYVVHPEVATYSDPALAGGGQGRRS